MNGELFSVDELSFPAREGCLMASEEPLVAPDARFEGSDDGLVSFGERVEDSDRCFGECSTMGCVGGMSDCIVSFRS